MTDVDSGQAVSTDGTVIGYRLVGAGPPLLPAGEAPAGLVERLEAELATAATCRASASSRPPCRTTRASW